MTAADNRDLLAQVLMRPERAPLVGYRTRGRVDGRERSGKYQMTSPRDCLLFIDVALFSFVELDLEKK